MTIEDLQKAQELSGELQAGLDAMGKALVGLAAALLNYQQFLAEQVKLTQTDVVK